MKYKNEDYESLVGKNFIPQRCIIVLLQESKILPCQSSGGKLAFLHLKNFKKLPQEKNREKEEVLNCSFL